MSQGFRYPSRTLFVTLLAVAGICASFVAFDMSHAFGLDNTTASRLRLIEPAFVQALLLAGVVFEIVGRSAKR